MRAGRVRRRHARAVRLSALLAGLECAVEGAAAASLRQRAPRRLPDRLLQACERAGLSGDGPAPEAGRLEGVELSFPAMAEPEVLAAWSQGVDLTLFVPRPLGFWQRLRRRISRWIARPPPSSPLRLVTVRIAPGDRARIAFETFPPLTEEG